MSNQTILRPGKASGSPALKALPRPVIILVGPFGSGKTEIAVNLAFGMRDCGDDVTVVDLDLVKPYFRCRLAKEALEARGIRLVAPTGNRFYADLPILVPEARAAGQGSTGREGRVLFDVGGAALGVRALGSISGLLDPKTAEMLFVVNINRPFAEDLPSLRTMFDQVQAAARLPVTGLVANTHLMDETTPETVRGGIHAARKLEAASGIPLRFCAMQLHLARAFGGPEGHLEGLPILAIERFILAPFGSKSRGAQRRSTVV